MAIYHLRASVISRSSGRSATAAAAYRAAELIEDRRTGLSFDYASKCGVKHTEILAPDHAPDWVSDRSELWNRVECWLSLKSDPVMSPRIDPPIVYVGGFMMGSMLFPPVSFSWYSRS
jgi:hypothetical protein